MRKILGVFEVFLGVFEQTKEKKERVRIRDITISGSLMSQEYPAQKLCLWAVFSVLLEGPKRQRSGEGVVRRNGCPKGCFWRVRFFFAPLSFFFQDISGVLRANLKGAEKKRTLQKHPFGQSGFRKRGLANGVSPILTRK